MNHLLSPANPTFPIQDQFNRINMAPGLTKLEYAAIAIFSSVQDITETESVMWAERILSACNERTLELIKAGEKKDTNLILNK